MRYLHHYGIPSPPLFIPLCIPSIQPIPLDQTFEKPFGTKSSHHSKLMAPSRAERMYPLHRENAHFCSKPVIEKCILLIAERMKFRIRASARRPLPKLGMLDLYESQLDYGWPWFVRTEAGQARPGLVAWKFLYDVFLQSHGLGDLELGVL